MLIDSSMIMNCGSGSPYLWNFFVFLYIFQENKKVSKFKYYVEEIRDKRSYNMKQQKHSSCYKVLQA